jgi:16S rRNA (cytidine1402-2'-O)-methyltransferase
LEKYVGVNERGILFVVSTPIGNLEDITLRALRVLREVDLIAAEDTRQTAKLLRRYGISTPLISFFEHNQLKRGPYLIKLLAEGRNVALVSDAGTPILSDPGFFLVTLALKQGIRLVPIPGPSAAMTALSVAGIPGKSFAFEGFLPAKKGPRVKRLLELAAEKRTMIFYESPHRLKQTLKDILSVFGDRWMLLAKEMTKIYETYYRGNISTVLEKVEESVVKGEYTVLISGASLIASEPSTVLEELKRIVSETNLTMKEIVIQVARKRNIPKREVYQQILKLRDQRQ